MILQSRNHQGLKSVLVRRVRVSDSVFSVDLFLLVVVIFVRVAMMLFLARLVHMI